MVEADDSELVRDVATAREEVRRAAALLARVEEVWEARAKGEDGDYWDEEPIDGDLLTVHRENIVRHPYCEEDYQEDVMLDAVRVAVRDLWSAAEVLTDAATYARRVSGSILDDIQECSGMSGRLAEANEALDLMRAIMTGPPS